jgi:hypothetical protein
MVQLPLALVVLPALLMILRVRPELGSEAQPYQEGGKASEFAAPSHHESK